MADEPLDDALVSRLVAYQESLESGTARSSSDSSLDERSSDDVQLTKHQQCLELLFAVRQQDARGDDGFAAPLAQQTLTGKSLGPDPQGRFRLLEQLGIGGFGIVWRAIDPATGRIVAVKVPRPEVLARPDLRRRFQQEAEAAARLDHPNILPIFEAGTDGVVPYIASPYYNAPTLADWHAANPGQIAPRLAAQIAAALADALAHAHERDVLHRDVKPSNVLLIGDTTLAESATMTFVPKLMDFGLAKVNEQSSDLTRTGELLGTVRYMSPEQASGRTNTIGPKADIYCLGAILFELLSGAPPFASDSDLEVLRRIAGEDPSRIRVQCPEVPKDLETICLKCLEKEPARRYSSARALQADLERFLAGRPILARASTMPERLIKWARRKPALAGLWAVSLLAVATLVGGLIWSNVRISRALEATQASERLARERVLEARQYAYASDMQLADRAWQSNDVVAMAAIVDRYRSDEHRDVRGAEWRWLDRHLEEASQLLGKFEGEVGSVAYSLDGRWIAATSTDGTLQVWDATDRRTAWTWREPDQAELNGVRFSPDEAVIAVASNCRVVRLLDAATGELIRTLEGGHIDWVADVDFSPNGQLLASVGADGRLVIWQRADGKLISQRQLRAEEIRCVHFLADGKHLATGAELGPIEIWPLEGNALVATLPLPPPKMPREERGVWPRKIAVRGNRMAAAFIGGGLEIWDVTEPAAPRRVQHVPSGDSRSVSFLDDDLLAVGRTDHAIEIRTIGRADPDAVHQRHEHQVLCVAASPARDEFVSGSKDGTARLWSIGSTDWHPLVATFHEPVFALAIVPGTTPTAPPTLIASTAREIKFLDVSDGQTQDSIATSAVNYLAVSPDGTMLAGRKGSGSLVVWNLPGKKLIKEVRWNDPGASPTRFLPQGDCLIGAHGHELEALDTATWKSRWKIELDGSIAQAIVNYRGDRVYVAEHAGTILELDSADGRVLRRLRHHKDRVHGIAVSPDGAWLATSCTGGGDVIWDLKSGQVARSLASTPIVKTLLQFTPDGRNLIAVGHQRQLRCWHVPTGQQTLRLVSFGRYEIQPRGVTYQGTMYIVVSLHGKYEIRAVRLP